MPAILPKQVFIWVHLKAAVNPGLLLSFQILKIAKKLGRYFAIITLTTNIWQKRYITAEMI